MSGLDQRQAMRVLSALPGLGPVTLRRLLDAFGGEAAGILAASPAALRRVVSERKAERIVRWAEHVDLPREDALLEAHGVAVVLHDDPGYPQLLKALPDAPLVLYTQGRLPLPEPAVALVGTRHATRYGLKTAHALAAGLAEAGVAVVSGLARGIDAAAHEGALSVEGYTAGVLGNGVDVVYPPEHRELYARVAAQGALISEFPMGRRADRRTFPQRNRLVSGMCAAVVVVESDIEGGSLITARFALEQHRLVFAVPGRIDVPQAAGAHQLIREGAQLCTCVEDVLEELRQPELALGRGVGQAASEARRTVTQALPLPELPEDEAAVAARFVEGDCLHPDQLCQLLGRPVQEVAMLLMALELKGVLSKRPDGFYERA